MYGVSLYIMHQVYIMFGLSVSHVFRFVRIMYGLLPYLVYRVVYTVYISTGIKFSGFFRSPFFVYIMFGDHLFYVLQVFIMHKHCIFYFFAASAGSSGGESRR